MTNQLETLKSLREEGPHRWGICIIIGQLPIRSICPHEGFEVREDFGCIEWKGRRVPGKESANPGRASGASPPR